MPRLIDSTTSNTAEKSSSPVVLFENLPPCSSILGQHIEHCEQYARKTITKNLDAVKHYHGRQRQKRLKCVSNRDWYLSKKVRQRMRDNDQRDLTHIDPSVLSLHTIPEIPLVIERFGKSRTSPPSTSQTNDSQSQKLIRARFGGLALTKFHAVPRYDAWIPVLVNYWVGKDLHLEPYMPFLGDQDDECETAFEVYEDMAGDAGKDAELSDGELNLETRKFVLPLGEEQRVQYFSMAQTRWREAMRKAIMAVLDRLETKDNVVKRRRSGIKFIDDQVWRVLSQALGVGNDIERVKAIARVAEERRQEKSQQKHQRKYNKKVIQEIDNLYKLPQDETLREVEDCSASTNVLKHFCFTCHTIPCAQHTGMDVEPVLPIEDDIAIQREQTIRDETAPPCSNSCGLKHVKRARLKKKKMNRQVNFVKGRKGNLVINFEDDEDDNLASNGCNDEPIDLTSDLEWTAEEILLLRDSITIFGMDPCSLAVVIGSKTCAEVAVRLEDPIEADILHCELRRARAPRRTLGEKWRGKVAKGAKMDVVLGYDQKTIVDVSDGSAAATDQDFEPCEHPGPCTVENNCSCAKKGLFCESTCGCNFGRYSQRGKTGGIVWVPPSEQSVTEKRAAVCENRHYGCSCTHGTCTGPQCPCWENYRACNPDFCECDVCCLPGHVSIAQRQCRNWPITVGTHKRTFIGKSEVHGFGLFAAERFEEGDLVGVYSGQLIDTRLADMIGRIYDATNRTYIFNMTETLVIDGGLLGSKAKFVNHTKPGARENCGSRLVRVRGDAYVALFAKRAVNAGEEFLFDYRFTGEVPAWAKDDKAGKSRK